MKPSIIVLDDFYNNPDDVRKYALSLPFNVYGNYPGGRTSNQINDSAKNLIQHVLYPVAGRVVNWLDDDSGYTGAFQVCLQHETTWIHQDDYNNWAGVLYLSPNPPLNTGTSFYRHRATISCDSSHVGHSLDGDGADYSKWDEVDVVKNKFNRLILFRANQFHASTNHFGDNLHNGRLTQVFFIKTEQ